MFRSRRRNLSLARRLVLKRGVFLVDGRAGAGMDEVAASFGIRRDISLSGAPCRIPPQKEMTLADQNPVGVWMSGAADGVRHARSHSDSSVMLPGGHDNVAG